MSFPSWSRADLLVTLPSREPSLLEDDMSLLGDFLERLYHPDHQLRSVHARVRSETREVVPGPTSPRPPIGRRKVLAEVAPVVVAEGEMWGIAPDRGRVEATRVVDGISQTTIELGCDGKSTRRKAGGEVELILESDVGPQYALPTAFRRHFDPVMIRELIAAMYIEELGPAEVAGRPCVRLRGVNMPSSQFWPHVLPSEADEFELAADLAAPAFLSIKGKLGGEEFFSRTITLVEYDVPVDEQLFADLGGGTDQESRREPFMKRLTLKEAIVQAPYAVLLPSVDLKGGDPVFMADTKHGTIRLTVFYHGANFHYTLRPAASPDLEDDAYEWEPVAFAGEIFEVSDPGVEGGTRLVRFAREETRVQIMSDRPRDELLYIAHSFAPAAQG